MPDDYDPIERPRHYCHKGGIESFEFIQSNRLGFAAGNVVKYIIRYEEKGGVVDLEKARWYLDRLIDEEISGR